MKVTVLDKLREQANENIVLYKCMSTDYARLAMQLLPNIPIVTSN